MIDPIYAQFYFSVISHFGSGDRITVFIFFQLLTSLPFSNKLRVRLPVHVHVWSEKYDNKVYAIDSNIILQVQ